MTVGRALLLVLLAAVGLFVAGGRLGLGLATTQVLFIGLPVFADAARRGDLEGIGLRRPRLRELAGGALVGASGWAFLASTVLPIQEHFFPAPPALEESIQKLIQPDLASLVIIAVVPAVCEELLLRGGLAFALERRFGRAPAVLGSALAFAALHASPYRLAPTFVLGCFFGAIALRTRSIVPTMLAHALNNGAIWLFATFPSVQAVLQANAPAVLGSAVATLTLGLMLVFSPIRPTQ